uniref:hypothetical protein n=1 Tax=Prevotella sp. TaxID=59823 RepID=UPI00402A1BFE
FHHPSPTPEITLASSFITRHTSRLNADTTTAPSWAARSTASRWRSKKGASERPVMKLRMGA